MVRFETILAKEPFGKLHLESPRRTCGEESEENKWQEMNRLIIELNYGVQYNLLLQVVFSSQGIVYLTN
jgi:hypothetical protein